MIYGCKFVSTIFAVVLSLGGLWGVAPVVEHTADAGWLHGWSNRVQLTIEHSSIDSTLSDFPVLVYLSSSSGLNKADVSSIFDTLDGQNNRRKIAVTLADGVTQLYVEIEKWDTARKQAWLWVKVPTISTTADTILFLYYDNSHADNADMVGDTDSAPAQHVWDAKFVMVQHLEQSATGHAGEFKDSTGRQHDGTGESGKFLLPLPRLTSSIIGEGQFFDNSACITIPDNDDFSVTTTGEMTISMWVSEAVPNFSSGGLVNFMGKGDTNQYEWSFVFYQRDWTDRSQRISFYLDNPQGRLGSGSYTQKPIGVNEWVYITAKVDSQYTYIYRNGMLSRHDPYQGPGAYVEINPQNRSEPVRIGTRDFETWFEGRIDEVRISNVSRSSAWIAASYLAESDNLIRMGPFENDQLAISPIENISAHVGKTITLDVSADSRNGKPLVYSASNLPQRASFDQLLHIFSWTPDAGQAGIYKVLFTVSDGVLSASKEVTITVVAAPPGPTTREPSENSNTRPIMLLSLGAAILVSGVMSIFILRHRR